LRDPRLCSYADVSSAKLTIFEHRVGGGEQADPSKQPVDFARFADHLMWLRGHTVSKRYHNASVLVEQLLVADVADISSAIDGGNAGGDVWEAVSEALAEASDQMQESVKVIVSFLQVNGSFLLTFNAITWPQGFVDVAGIFNGIFSIDWINPALLGESASSLNYCDGAPCAKGQS
jgi:hypothetical protein